MKVFMFSERDASERLHLVREMLVKDFMFSERDASERLHV